MDDISAIVLMSSFGVSAVFVAWTFEQLFHWATMYKFKEVVQTSRKLKKRRHIRITKVFKNVPQMFSK